MPTSRLLLYTSGLAAAASAVLAQATPTPTEAATITKVGCWDWPTGCPLSPGATVPRTTNVVPASEWPPGEYIGCTSVTMITYEACDPTTSCPVVESTCRGQKPNAFRTRSHGTYYNEIRSPACTQPVATGLLPCLTPKMGDLWFDCPSCVWPTPTLACRDEDRWSTTYVNDKCYGAWQPQGAVGRDLEKRCRFAPTGPCTFDPTTTTLTSIEGCGTSVFVTVTPCDNDCPRCTYTSKTKATST